MSKSINKDNKDYSQFSFDDFLLDDFFIESIINSTEETILFWTSFEHNMGENSEEYTAAKKCLEDANRNLLEEDKVVGIWENIRKANKSSGKLNFSYFIGLAVAASIAILIFFKLYPEPSDQEIEVQSAPDIIAFAKQNRPANPDDVQLIVADDRVIALNESEPEVIYDSTSIKTGSLEISKKQSSSFNQLVIPKGKRSVLTLSDGTRIWINSGSRIIFPVNFDQNKREIFLDGEIYLNVAHDGQRPFIVKTDDIAVQVLGTKFNIQAYSEDVQKRVVLESGSVKISSDKRETLLNPAEMYEGDSEKETVEQVDIELYTSWIEGIYIYEKERLDVILTRLSRYYGKEIEIDAASSGLRCTGKLDLKDNIDDVLDIIKFTAPVSYSIIDDKYMVTYKSKKPMEEIE